ncbi:MAG: hypothetical protein H8E34_09830 [Bacteroidetes bacterium]|nr:hypothetical protein [Bacteroidota bacterium]MBL6942763.1 hypothetical protein [Bacteroidales bacterium]
MIKEKIELMIFEDNKKHIAEISSHIESCDTCQSNFTESMRAKNIIGQMQKEPELHDPDNLTKRILSRIDEIDQTPKSKNSNPKIYWLIRRSLAVASISLMIVFGIEQYMQVDKISKMEEHVSFISKEHKNVNLYNIINYNLGFKPESFNKAFTKDLINASHLNLKTSIIRTRVSSMAINKLDNQRINQIMQEVSARIINNTN